jgi:predicted ATPase/DNA-binding winged helix-turn-helix (wHTH) protein
MLTEGVPQVYASGVCEIDLARRELRVRGSTVPLGARAFEIIEVLVQSPGELVTRDALMDRVWHNVIVSDNTLQVHISALRKALGSQRAILKTESGRGYRLLGNWAIQQDRPPLPSLAVLPQARERPDAPPTNFPAIVTDLVGRTVAVDALRDLVSAYRVVTLTGPGGIGKSTLALHVGRGLLADFGSGGRLVELASLSDPDLVPSAVASVLELKLGGGRVSADSLARAIGEQHLLLLLDNCEHLIDAVAELVETTMRLCPRVSVLATSREVLRIQGEHVYRVPPLEVPASDQLEPERIRSHSAVELFIARATALASDFASHAPRNLPAIAAICRQVDGIPLAIEFAAARAATLGIDQVASALRDRFAVLMGGRRTALPRHRTLRATLDWSYDLLPEAERQLLRRLAIFPAGFALDAAAAVMADTALDRSAVANGIANLVAKSLVALDKSEGAARWYLLETIRAYALEILVEHGEADVTARHQACHLRDLFAFVASNSDLPDSRPWIDDGLARRIREIDNVRAALDWSFSAAGDAAIGVHLTAAYAPAWLYLSLMAECRQRCERALNGLQPASIADRRVEMWLQIALGMALIETMGPAEQATTVLTTALGAAVALGDLDAQARALTMLSTTAIFRGEYGKVRTAVEHLEQVARQLDDPTIARVADRVMGIMWLNVGRPRAAQRYLERSLQFHASSAGRQRSLWYPYDYRASTRAFLSRALWLQGFADKARSEAQGSLDEFEQTDHQLSLCRVLYFGMCRVAPMIGDLVVAERSNARLIEVATNLDAPFWKTVGRFVEGKLLVERREFTVGLALLREAFETCQRTGWRISYPEFRGVSAVALAGLGRRDEALGAVDEALANADDQGEKWYVPELLRIKGEILLQYGADTAAAQAENCFFEALRTARDWETLFWELRVSLSIARMRLAQGRREEARQILSPVYQRFTEGFDTTDMRAAKALLEAAA